MKEEKGKRGFALVYFPFLLDINLILKFPFFHGSYSFY